MNQPQLKKARQFIWENTLTFAQRAELVKLYLKGVSISALTSVYPVHISSVKYHLIKEGVYIPWKKPTITIKRLHLVVKGFSRPMHMTQPSPHVEQRDEFHWPPHEATFPKSYKEYLIKAKQKHERSF